MVSVILFRQQKCHFVALENSCRNEKLIYVGNTEWHWAIPAVSRQFLPCSLLVGTHRKYQWFLPLRWYLMDNVAFFYRSTIWKQSGGDRAEIRVRTIYIFNRRSQGGSRLRGAGVQTSALYSSLQQTLVSSPILYSPPFGSYGAQWGVPKPNWIVLSNIYNARLFCFTVSGMEWRAASGVWVQYRLERWGVAGLTPNQQNKD